MALKNLISGDKHNLQFPRVDHSIVFHVDSENSGNKGQPRAQAS